MDIILGTEDEVNAAMLTHEGQMTLTHSQISDTKVKGNTQQAIATFLELGPQVVVEKRGEKGATLHLKEGAKIISNPVLLVLL